MKVSYFPGCSLHGTAREYAESVETVCKALGVNLQELEDWNCCGASSAHVVNEDLAIGLAARNVEIADRTGLDLVVPCAACYQRLKAADKALRANGTGNGHKYAGNFNITHIVDFFWKNIGEKEICERVKKPLTGLNPVSYYGCLTARPSKITDSANPDNPEAMDNLLASLGASVKDWSSKTDCCGGSLMLTRPDIVRKLGQRLFDAALEAGADSIVTGCPMCFNNLDSIQQRLSRETGKKYEFPIFYITELMGIAFGVRAATKWLRRHFADPRPYLKQKSLI